MTDNEIIEEGRQSYFQYGDNPGLNPYLAGPTQEREARLWHSGFAAARRAKREAQIYIPRRQPAVRPTR